MVCVKTTMESKNNYFRSIKSICENSKSKKAVIYFHIDLDGVTTAILMRDILSKYGVEVVEAHPIQYGNLEWSIVKPKDDYIKIMVDFAHSKTFFDIHTDHHEHQANVSDNCANFFRKELSNAEMLNYYHNQKFTFLDETLIRIVDSAQFKLVDFFSEKKSTDDMNSELSKYRKKYIKKFGDENVSKFDDYCRNNIIEYDRDSNRMVFRKQYAKKYYRYDIPNDITNLDPNRVRNYLIKGKLNGSLLNRKMVLGLACNKVLLALKNKPQVLGLLVKQCKPSLMNIYIALQIIIKRFRLPNIEEMQDNGDAYVKRMKTYHRCDMDYVDNILTQEDGGDMFSCGSFDRYTPFNNFPDTNYFIMHWSVGIVQISYNPFREKRHKNVNLGEITKQILEKYKNALVNINITILDMKKESEKELTKRYKKSKNFGTKLEEMVGFTYSDLMSYYSDSLHVVINDIPIKIDFDNEHHKNLLSKLEVIYNKRYYELSKEEMEILRRFCIDSYTIINQNSGGHKYITNISGIRYLIYSETSLVEKVGLNYSKFISKIMSDYKAILINMIHSNKGEFESNTYNNEWSLYT